MTKEWGERAQALQVMLTEDAGDLFTRYALALEHRSEKRIDWAIRELREVLRRDAGYLAAYYQLARTLWEDEQNEEALAVAERGLPVAEAERDKKALEELQQLAADVRGEITGDAPEEPADEDPDAW